MKKTEKYIYIVLGIILVVVIACGITYMIAINNNKTETKEENKEQNNNQEEDNEEQITLSESELEEYLSYVPDSYVSISAYTTENKEELNNLILGSVLFKISNYNPGEISLTEVDRELQKMYNMSLNDFDLQISDDYVTGYSGMGYSYTGKEFIATDAGAPNYEKISLIEDYELIDDDLIIYELPATYWEYFDGEGYYLGDYTLLKKFDGATINFDLIKLEISYDEKNMDDAREYAYEYIQTHKDEFTLYKHTFKKNDTGYYWYSTEVEG